MEAPETKIRIAAPSDAAAIASLYAPIVRETIISFETEPPTAEVMAERIAKTIPMYPFLVAERDGELIGYAYSGQHRERAAYRWSVDVSVYISANARRSGAGRALYNKLFEILRQQNFRSAFAGIALPNDASVGLHEAVGFEPLGVYKEVGFKLGDWRDVGWWRLALSNAPGEPEEPRPFNGGMPT
jgi:phosphinothricin acetyltransferase